MAKGVSGNTRRGLGMLERLQQRVRGVPRSVRALNRSLQLLGSLHELGWQKTVATGRCVDAAGVPQPWFTLSAVQWLGTRLRSTDRVFEYGSGGSTLWFGTRVAHVVSVEDDPDWARYVRTHATEAVKVLEEPYGESYIRAPLSVDDTFDVVVVDGAEPRNPCAEIAPDVLREDGIVIWDNSDRPVYRPALEQLHDRGFGRVDFFGFALGLGTPACTSVFCRRWDRWVNVDVALPWFGT